MTVVCDFVWFFYTLIRIELSEYEKCVLHLVCIGPIVALLALLALLAY